MKRSLSILTSLLLSAAPLTASSGVGVPSLSTSTSTAAAAEERGIIALDQALRELANPYSVMCVAAHVDDIDWGTLAYYHRKLGARALLVLATTSEKGGDRTTSGLPEDAGAVAIRRALEAARIVGADVYLLNLPDAGTSRSADELVNLWGHEEALGQLVRAFRLLRPDAVVTNHSSRDDRVHLAIWRLVSEAFEAAADASRFSDATSKAWQVRRVFQRTDEVNADVTVNVAEFDHIRGLSYSQIADSALQERRGSTTDRQTGKTFYKLARSSRGERLKPGASLLDDLPLSENLTRSIAAPVVGSRTMSEAINQREPLIEALIEKLIEKRTEGSANELFDRYGPEFFRVLRFRELLERAIALALGLDFSISAADSVVVPGQKLSARLVLKNGADRALPVVFHTPESLPDIGKTSPSVASEVATLPPGGVVSRDLQYELRPDAQLTVPHSSARLSGRFYYALGSALPDSQSTNPFGHELVAYADVGVGQTSIILPAVFRYDVAPPVEIQVRPSFALVRDWKTPREMEFMVSLRNRTPGRLGGALWVVPAAITDVEYEPAHIEFALEDEVVRVKLKIKLPILKPPLAPDVLLEFRREKPAPPDPLASTKIAVTGADFEVGPGISLGFIRGFSLESDLTLSQLGVEASEISVDSLRVHETGGEKPSRSGCSDLSHFDSIIVDSFTYLAESNLISASACLFEYVRKGGNLIVLGQRASGNVLSTRPELVPFPLDHSHRVSPPINVVAKDHPLLSKPNPLTEKDFEGWTPNDVVQPLEWPGDYISLIEVSDRSEGPKRLVLLFGHFGEGTYIYSSLNLAEQMSAGNQTAYRLLANLVGASKSRKQRRYDEW